MRRYCSSQGLIGCTETVYATNLKQSLEISELSWIVLLTEVCVFFGLSYAFSGNKDAIIVIWILAGWSTVVISAVAHTKVRAGMRHGSAAR